SELISNNILLSSPNNTLGISYVRAIQKCAPTIQPWTISREQSAHHDESINNLNFASGTSIRKSIQSGDKQWQNVVPESAKDHYVLPHLSIDETLDRKSTRLNSSHVSISYAVFCLKKKRTSKK